MYNSSFYGLLYVGDKNILCVCKLYLFKFSRIIFIYYIWLNYMYCIRAKIILVLYEVIISPLRMNIVSTSAFVVEQLINICGI